MYVFLFSSDLLRSLTFLAQDPHCIERQIISFTPEGRQDLAEKAMKWLERQKAKGREFSVIVRPFTISLMRDADLYDPSLLHFLRSTFSENIGREGCAPVGRHFRQSYRLPEVISLLLGSTNIESSAPTPVAFMPATPSRYSLPAPARRCNG